MFIYISTCTLLIQVLHAVARDIAAWYNLPLLNNRPLLIKEERPKTLGNTKSPTINVGGGCMDRAAHSKVM